MRITRVQTQAQYQARLEMARRHNLKVQQTVDKLSSRIRSYEQKIHTLQSKRRDFGTGGDLFKLGVQKIGVLDNRYIVAKKDGRWHNVVYKSDDRNTPHFERLK